MHQIPDWIFVGGVIGVLLLIFAIDNRLSDIKTQLDEIINRLPER